MGLTIEQVAGWAYKNLWRRGDALSAPSLTVKGDVDVGGIISAPGGIVLNDDVLNTYVSDVYEPTLSAPTPPTLTYTRQQGYYVRIGYIVFYSGRIEIAGITVAGSGNARIGLPVQAINTYHHNPPGSCVLYGPNLDDATKSLAIIPNLNTTHAQIWQTKDDAFASALPITAFAAGDIIEFGGFYFSGNPLAMMRDRVEDARKDDGLAKPAPEETD